ncbi:ribosome recycling factor [Piptocephalis cylindrospora]|uniref:Ribosome recycling factor n=1 Tax=Piptocephalis cylindrospora TaxID=1907219 RepID=A0A4P9Y1Z9_9FUNG|nr:ribosome recycling factor [Piptocephalis cylindrospora]|eukprot:RKP12896.1 ribosome recycling factor [Piptocephalis cylindrospora]
MAGGSVFDAKALEARMAECIEHLKKDFAALRVGRANPRLLDSVMVRVEGEMMPLLSVSRVSTKDPLTLFVSVHDPDHLISVDKAIREAGMGLNPRVERGVVLVPVPKMTKELRDQSVKEAGKAAEAARVAVRAVRQAGMKQAKAANASKDDQRKDEKRVQNLTDGSIKDIDGLLKSKTQDISQS